jgi:hypothetical protein
MIPFPILAAERELRLVIERRRAGDISKCLAAYGEVARQQVNCLRPNDPVRRQVCERVLSVLDWARLMLNTRRSILAENLRALQRTQRFLGTEPSAGPRFRQDL